MKNYTLFLSLVVLQFLPACSLIPLKAQDQLVSGASKYCAALTATERGIIRDGANAKLSEKDIALCGVKCPGEAAPVVPACQAGM